MVMHVMCWWKIVKYVLTREQAEPLTSPPPPPGPTLLGEGGKLEMALDDVIVRS